MRTSLSGNSIDLSAFGKNWGWFLLWGIALIVLGAAAISATTLTTLISVALLGALILAGGIIVLIDTFTFWRHKPSGFFLHLIMGILYVIVGASLIYNPFFASVSLTLLLGIFYILIGISRLVFSLSIKNPRWGWNFFNGLIALLLGMLILANWPASSLYIIGLFVGIDLLFSGWAYLMASLAARAITR